jgi:hypothetical protein
LGERHDRKERDMVQNDRFSYKVTTNEQVVVEVTPMNGAAGQQVSAAVDGNTIANVGSDESPRFEFTAAAEDGKYHDLVLVLSFVDPNPDDAHFTVKVSGSGNEEYDGGTFRKSANTVHRPAYEFEVSA